MQECYVIFSCRKIESLDWKDVYKHHNLGTNFDFFYRSEFKIPLVIENYILTDF